MIGGSAYQIIVPFIDHSFGLDTYSRIIKPEDELASIKSRGITGARAGISEQFRDKYKIINFAKFGKITKEIHLRLSQETTDEYFSFLKRNKKDRIQIFVGKGFKIKKDLDFDYLHRIITELGHILELAISEEHLSSYKEINDVDLIETKLKPQLIYKIYEDSEYSNKQVSSTKKRFEFDFCNPNNIEKFYEADEYKLKEKGEAGGYEVFATVIDRNDIYQTVLSRAVLKSGTDFFAFRAYIQGVRITCQQNKKQTIGSSFLFHFTTEFNIDDKPVFLVDTKWYHLKDSFVTDLKLDTKKVLESYPAPSNILHIPWNKDIINTEKEYNLQYNKKKNYIVIDTIIVDGIELCDILYYDDTNLYLIHVKYGFNSKMRELSNQITISARRLNEIRGKNDEMLEKIYGQLIEKKHDIDNLTLEDFQKLFSKKITYVLGFTSHLKDDLKVQENIDKFESNIARFSLIQCSIDIKTNYFDMLTHQISRS
ncbi:MAG: hypothetical protein JNM51_10950 [Bacteroidia bacterium]|nr:hypothetical protein [Bacteroidia bacterium]